MSLLSKIWRYNVTTGCWAYVRDCYKERTQDWLRIFRSDEPGAVFKVAAHRPRKPPTQP